MWKLSGSQVVFSWPPAMFQVIVTAWNHLSSASGKPSSCPTVWTHHLSPSHQEGPEGFRVQERHKYPCALSASQESQRRAPSGLEDMASKTVLPALLSVNGSIYSHVPATACPLVTYPGALASTAECTSSLVTASGAVAALISVNTPSEQQAHCPFLSSTEMRSINKEARADVHLHRYFHPPIIKSNFHGNTCTCNLLPSAQEFDSFQ